MKISSVFLLIFLLISFNIFSQILLEGNYIKCSGVGGTPPYEYRLDNNLLYQVSDTFFNVSSGLHYVYIKDSRNCIQTLTCNLYAPLVLSVLSTTTTSVTLNAIGGKTPYYYSKNSTTSYTLNKTTWTNLTRGRTYTFRVKDALNYVSSVTMTLN